MPERVKAENLLDNFMETFAESIPRKKPLILFQEENSASRKVNRLFGRQQTLHNVLGGGKSADVLLWRNKKISTSSLIGATVIWVLFEWLNYNFLALICSTLAIGTILLFVWSNASGFLNRSESHVPRLILPDELFLNIAITVGTEINQFLCFLQDVATGHNMKQFFATVAGLWAAAVIGSWCNFLSMLYIGFVAAHTLPVLYEKYEDELDTFVINSLGQLQHHCKKLDSSVLKRLPKRMSKKFN